MISPKIQQRIRRAVTLVEVIFAIGVILIGMLGLLSILPLAGKRSQDSISLSTGPQIANRVLAELKSNRFLSRNLLQRLDGNPLTVTTPFCLDPIFVSSPLTDRPAINTGAGYFAGHFPFFDLRHNPTADPLQTQPAQSGFTQPRMYRVGLRDSLGFVPGTVARVFSENRDDLINTRPDDRSIPVRLSDGEIQPITSGLEYGKRIPSGEFSWMVTVNPLPGGVYASVAVVVFRNRILELEFPPNKNHVGERLVNISYAQGFRGGAGGVAHLQCNKSVDSTLIPGDWIMLSKNTTTGPVHHWYRVVGLDGDPQITGATWKHKVLLDGPDWSFGYNADGTADSTMNDNTYATIVSGVVCVNETILKLSEI